MARPSKHNADYFSHDVHMRNDLKIKSLRRKFGHTGYSIWIMVLELLTHSDYFEFKWNDENILLLEADFDCDTDEIKSIVEHCVKLNLLQIVNGYLTCDKLMNRLESEVLQRRTDYCRENANRFQLEVVNVNNNEVIDNNNGQSKGKETKLNETEVKDTKRNESEVKYTEGNKTEAEKFDDVFSDLFSEVK
jgi:hypothetical protein